MKNLIFSLLFGCFALTLIGQDFPSGIQYQAVARTTDGSIISDHELALQVSFVNHPESGQLLYSEIHTTKTNQYGLFDIVIGHGESVFGNYQDVQWSKNEIWMELAMDLDGGDQFEIINTNKLFSVPYAIHAQTAGSVIEDEKLKSNVLQEWIVGGQDLDRDNTLGSLNEKDVNIITSGIIRIYITKEGAIRFTPPTQFDANVRMVNDLRVNRDVYIHNTLFGMGDNYLNRLTVEGWLRVGGQVVINGPTLIKNSLKVTGDVDFDADLNVGGNTVLAGTLVVDGQSDFNGPVNVNNMSPTNLSGTLNVDKRADFNNTLSVNNMSPTILTGTLRVDKETNLNSSLDVNNTSPTNLTGTLNVDGTTDLNSSLDVNNNSPTKLTGTLNVDGTTDLNSSLDVNNSSPTNLTGTLNVDGTTDLNSSLDVNNSSPTNLTGTLNVDGKSTLTNLDVSGDVKITSTTASSSTTTGSLVTSGGVGVAGEANFGQGMHIQGSGYSGGDQNNFEDHVLRVEGGDQGIAVKSNFNTPDRNANFMTFFGADDTPLARIEGFRGIQGAIQSIAASITGEQPDSTSASNSNQSLNQSPGSVPANAEQFFNSDYGVDLISAALEFIYTIVQFVTNLTGAALLCLGGDCDDVIWSALDMVKSGVMFAGVIVYNEINLGGTFESGGADYAEWLRVNDEQEKFAFGDVVGLKGGLISKNFEDAEKYMVISSNPSILGAMPKEGNEYSYEKVAFMGQVPVKTIGKVDKGDYLIPSITSPGVAMSVHPDDMLARDYQRIIGIAWENSDPDVIFSYINTAVGINSNDMSKVIEQMQVMINKLQTSMAEINPNFEAVYFDTGNQQISISNTQISAAPSFQEIIYNNSDYNFETVEQSLAPVAAFVESQEINFDQYPFLMDLLNNPSDKDLAYQTLEYYKTVLENLETTYSNVINNMKN